MRLPTHAALLMLTSCRLATFDETLTYRCGPAGECEAGLVCRDGFCEVPGIVEDAGCVPHGCFPDDCSAQVDDGCGGVIDCGPCMTGLVCGALRPNKCDCVKADAGAQVCQQPGPGQLGCGTKAHDNCGTVETFTCGGDCPGNMRCFENVCCLPPTEAELCTSAHFGCGRGEVIDRCGVRRVLDCGLCGMGQRCHADDVGSQCVPSTSMCEAENDPELCDARGANCGTVSTVDRCGVARTVSCGGACDAGACTSSQPNQCACQPLRAGCMLASQCCTGLLCSAAGLCCVGDGQACGDDADCCGSGSCELGICCAGSSCHRSDGGSTWDGGEL
ncbi:MAG: hypothetical protein JNK82_28340 [Myxococcaceae bacterium]|nr:hypothetical protein [Myxococcaceae bacterium]